MEGDVMGMPRSLDGKAFKMWTVRLQDQLAQYERQRAQYGRRASGAEDKWPEHTGNNFATAKQLEKECNSTQEAKP